MNLLAQQVPLGITWLVIATVLIGICLLIPVFRPKERKRYAVTPICYQEVEPSDIISEEFLTNN